MRKQSFDVIANQQWDRIRTGFELRGGIPNAVGAIDGSLIEIERPNDFDGWYNRKGYE